MLVFSKRCIDDQSKQILTIISAGGSATFSKRRYHILLNCIVPHLKVSTWSRTLENLRIQTKEIPFPTQVYDFAVNIYYTDIFVQFHCKASLTNKPLWRLDITWNFLSCPLEFYFLWKYHSSFNFDPFPYFWKSKLSEVKATSKQFCL